MTQVNQINDKLIAPKSSKPYLFFLSGQLISLFGSSIVQFSLIWWITVTASVNDPDSVGTVLGIASFLGFAPMIFTTMFAGVLVDRWSRKKVIAIVDFLQAFFTGILMVLFFLNIANLLYVLVILAIRSFFQGFHTPAVQAVIPLLVPREKLTQVNSFENLATGLIFLIGPVTGALVVSFVGIEQIGLIMSIDLITFLIAIVPLVLIHIPSVRIKNVDTVSKNDSFRSEFMEGITFIKNKKGLLSLLTTFTIANIFLTPIGVLLPLVVTVYFASVFIEPLNLTLLSVDVLAYTMAFVQAGIILMSLLLTTKTIFKSNVKGVAIGQTVMYLNLFILAYSILVSNFYLLILSAFIQGVSNPLANVHSQTIWQSVVPPELQGRVMSVRMVIAWIFNPFSMLFAGVLADMIGAQLIFAMGGAIGIIFLVYIWLFTGFPRVEEQLGLKGKKHESDSELITKDPLKVPEF